LQAADNYWEIISDLSDGDSEYPKPHFEVLQQGFEVKTYPPRKQVEAQVEAQVDEKAADVTNQTKILFL